MTEDEFTLVDRGVRVAVAHFQFGYHTKEDMYQQGWIFALEAMPSFDGNPARLAGFIYTHVTRRMINFKRNTYHRPQPPCKKCQFATANDGCELVNLGQFSSKDECPKYATWVTRNHSKRQLHYLMPINDESMIKRASSDLLDIVEFVRAEAPELLSYVEAASSGERIPIAQRRQLCILLEDYNETNNNR